MNARFSFSLFEQPYNLAELQIPAQEAALAGPPAPTIRDGRSEYTASELRPAGDWLLKAAGEQIAGIDEVFIPDHYEPNYAYPLLVWLQTTKWPRGGFDRIMRMVSDRNYFGVAAPIVDADHLDEQLPAMFARLRRRYHLHTERVFLAGIGEAGTQALTTGLGRPDLFGGVAAISSPWPSSPRLLARYHELRGKRVLLAVDDRDDDAVACGLARGERLLWSAGMQVTTVSCSNGGKTCPGLFREIDRWCMQSVEQPELVC